MLLQICTIIAQNSNSVGGDITSVAGDATSAVAGVITTIAPGIIEEVTCECIVNVIFRNSFPVAVGGSLVTVVTSAGGDAITLAGSAGGKVTSFAGAQYTAAVSGNGAVDLTSACIGLFTVVASALLGAVLTL